MVGISSSKEVNSSEEPVGINEEEWLSLLLLGWREGGVWLKTGAVPAMGGGDWNTEKSKLFTGKRGKVCM